MSRLIDADKLHSEFMKMAEFKPNSEIGEPTCGCTRRLVFHISEGIRKINEQPTVDAEPIRHGHWNILTPQDDDGGWVAISCSNCNFVTPYASSRKEIEENGFVYHYCMYCGAKMEELVDAGDENT